MRDPSGSGYALAANAAVQRLHNPGCAGSWPTSLRYIQQRSHFARDVRRTSTLGAAPSGDAASSIAATMSSAGSSSP